MTNRLVYHAFVHIGLFIFDGEEEGFSLCSSVSNRGVKISYCLPFIYACTFGQFPSGCLSGWTCGTGQIELHIHGALSFFRGPWINIKEVRIIIPVINLAVLKLINTVIHYRSHRIE